MQYKKLGNTGIDTSVISMGGEWLNGLSPNATKEIIDKAIKGGMNYIDIFMPQPETRSNIGYALKGQREKIYIQGHLCTVFEDGQYERTRDLKKVKESFTDLLIRLETDYIDVGMIHYVDSLEDYELIFTNGIVDYANELKANGIIKHIGLSSHNADVALKAVEEGFVDVLMFSINAAYDLQKSDTDIYELMDFKGLNKNGWEVDPARQKLYTTCQDKGVGITVMKALGAGSLLEAETSPFGVAMTVNQCCHYCLTRPGVSSVLIGCKSTQEVDCALAYSSAGEKELDYSHIFDCGHKLSMTGRCMYCNHCQPCPMHIDVAAVTKLLDLAVLHDNLPETVAQHYDALKNKGSACIKCSLCESNCPFGVSIMKNMDRAVSIFGE